MKLNNRGISLIELIVCLSLISVIVLFLYNLIEKINSTDSMSGFALNNQQNRIEIIKEIENDLLQKEIVGVNKLDNVITFISSDNLSSKISIYNENGSDHFVYVPFSGEENKLKWIIKNANLDYDDIIMCQDELIIKIIIKVITPGEINNSVHNNSIDDIYLTFTTKSNDLLNKCN